ncbi:MAG: ribonuclease catalytic domain-containing protein [Cyanobium sp.]
MVEDLRSGKAVLRIGWEGRHGHAPLRDLELIAAAPHQGSVPIATKASAAPWGLTRERVLSSLPARRELASAWQLLLGDPQVQRSGLELRGLADLLGSGGDPALRASLWLWLQGEQDWFRWRQQRAEARPPEDVRQRRRARRRQRLQETRRRIWHRILEARQPIGTVVLEAEAQAELALLHRWALGDGGPPLSQELLNALLRAHCPPEPAAIRHLLVDLGQWSRHRLPSLEASGWSTGFSSELQQEAERLCAAAATPQPGDEGREDLCGQHCFTIDDEDTVDIDDALGLEELPDGSHALWVHIADPGRLVRPGSPLDLEARRRASSLYLARGTLPMFPPDLANGVFSLRQGQRSAAWSLRIELENGGEVRSHRLLRSWIRPAYRLSYSDADELIELAPPQERSLLILERTLQQRRRWRLERGALCLDQPEGRIRSRGDKADLQIIEPSPARAMVAEAMILAGAVVASIGRRQGLALPYRSQVAAALPEPGELAQLEAGPVRHAALKRCLSRGHIGVTPAPHFSLGLDTYVQATSPIRRYGDLLVQRQLEAFLSGGVPLDGASLAAILEEIDGPMREGIRISRDDQRHWQQVWFEQNPQPSWAGRFLRWLRPQEQLALVHLEDLALELPALAPATCEPGTALRVKVVQVDSLRDQLRLQAST